MTNRVILLKSLAFVCVLFMATIAAIAAHYMKTYSFSTKATVVACCLIFGNATGLYLSRLK